MDSNLMILNEPDGQTLYNLSTAQFSIEKRFLVVLFSSSIFPRVMFFNLLHHQQVIYIIFYLSWKWSKMTKMTLDNPKESVLKLNLVMEKRLFIMHLIITVTSTLVSVLEQVKPIVKIEFNSLQQLMKIKLLDVDLLLWYQLVMCLMIRVKSCLNFPHRDW